MEPENSLPYLQKPAICRLSLARSIYSMPSHPTSWRFILILFSSLRLCLPSGLFPSGFHTKTLCTPLLFPIRVRCPAQLLLLGLITRIMFGEEDRSLSTSLCNLLHSSVTSSLLVRNILLNALFSHTLSLRSSLSVSDQVSHPYKTTGKIIVLFVFILIFSDRKLKNKKFCTEY